MRADTISAIKALQEHPSHGHDSMTNSILPAGIVIHRFDQERLPDEIDPLVVEARANGDDFVDGLIERWLSGENRFAGPGEALFMAWRSDGGTTQLCGLAGVGRDPYLNDPAIARLRHVYVGRAFRRQGIAEHLVLTCLAHADGHFPTIRLRTENPAAARIYERLGFAPVENESATHIKY